MSKQVKQNEKPSNKLLAPIILMMGFVPLIVHMFQYNANLSQYDWFSNGSDDQTDFFFACKMIAIIIIGVTMVAILAYRYFRKNANFRFENSFYMLFLYAMFVIMSALFSTHKYWVVRGMHALFEPVWVVFTYILLCYYTYNYVREEKQVKIILPIAGIGMFFVTLIGVFQYYGFDFFKSSLGKHVISNISFWNDLDQLSFKFADRTSYTTLYNPNFLSFYFGMLIPLIACLWLAVRKVWQKIALVIAEILCIICLKGSGSDSGWMAIALGVVILVLVLASRKKRTFGIVLAIMIVGGIVMLAAGGKTETGARIKDTITGTYHMKDRYTVREIRVDDDSAVVNMKGNDLHIAYSVVDGQAQPICWDENGAQVNLVALGDENNNYQINDARFTDVYIQPILLADEYPAVMAIADNITWRFINIDGDGYYYCNAAGKLVRPEAVSNADVFYDDAMSGRGHIWNMTIPLLGKHVFMGSGANTYMLEYPQDDYVAQEYIYGNSLQIKAHCWYLQQWIETGLIGTLALLVFLGWYVVRSIRIYRRVDLHDNMSWIGIGLFAAILVYLIAGVANDSNVCTAPMFWGMLGLGLAVNRMLAEKNNLFVANLENGKEQEKCLQKEQGRNTVDLQQEDDKSTKAIAATKQESSSVRKQASKKQSRKQRKNQKK